MPGRVRREVRPTAADLSTRPRGRRGFPQGGHGASTHCRQSATTSRWGWDHTKRSTERAHSPHVPASRPARRGRASSDRCHRSPAAHFGGGHTEARLTGLHHVLDDRSLGLERTAFGQVEVECEGRRASWLQDGLPRRPVCRSGPLRPWGRAGAGWIPSSGRGGPGLGRRRTALITGSGRASQGSRSASTARCSRSTGSGWSALATGTFLGAGGCRADGYLGGGHRPRLFRSEDRHVLPDGSDVGHGRGRGAGFEVGRGLTHLDVHRGAVLRVTTNVPSATDFTVPTATGRAPPNGGAPGWVEAGGDPGERGRGGRRARCGCRTGGCTPAEDQS